LQRGRPGTKGRQSWEKLGGSTVSSGSEVRQQFPEKKRGFGLTKGAYGGATEVRAVLAQGMER